MPVFEVECLAKVRKIYVIEAASAAEAAETASFNQAEDEYEVETSVVRVEDVTAKAKPSRS